MKIRLLALLLGGVLLLPALSACRNAAPIYEEDIPGYESEDGELPLEEQPAEEQEEVEEKIWIIPEQTFHWREGGDTSENMFSRPMRTLHEYDGALYYFSWPPVRYNPQTDVQISFCTDPLCTHDRQSKCPFYGIGSSLVLLEDSVILRREASGLRDPDTVELLDLNDLTLRKLREISGTMTIFGGDVVCGDTYIYVNLVYDEQEDSQMYELCRKDMKSGKVEVLHRNPNRRYVPLFAVGETIYLSCNEDDLIYTAPVDDLMNMAPVAQTRGNWFLDRAESCFYSLDSKTGTVYRSTSPEVPEAIFTVEGMDYFYMTDQHIYYRRVYGQAEEMTFYGELAYHNLYEYYRCDRDGGNAKLIYREEYALGEYTYFLRDFVVLGNYLYAPWTMQLFDGEIDDGKGSDKNINSSLVRIDIESGEWYYIMNE
ncbi:MAG: hypothetical protein IJW40_00595 [Clostridia bacterium]|nr:hypothetical protein [Clostridia bacterium]